MSRIVRRRTLFRLGALLLCPPLFGQSVPPATQPTEFHIAGTITGRGPSLAVVFEGSSSKAVMTNEAGAYQADLPLGTWTMKVFVPGPEGKIFTDALVYRRPPFRITAPTGMVFDIALPQGSLCDIHVGDGATQKEIDRIKRSCAGEEFFSVPSGNVPFELHVWGGSTFGCSRSNTSPACKRTFATYNTLSMQADDITYDRDESILEARGNVVTQDESGERKALSMVFYIYDGHAFLMHQDR